MKVKVEVQHTPPPHDYAQSSELIHLTTALPKKNSFTPGNAQVAPLYRNTTKFHRLTPVTPTQTQRFLPPLREKAKWEYPCGSNITYCPFLEKSERDWIVACYVFAFSFNDAVEVAAAATVAYFARTRVNTYVATARMQFKKKKGDEVVLKGMRQIKSSALTRIDLLTLVTVLSVSLRQKGRGGLCLSCRVPFILLHKPA